MNQTKAWFEENRATYEQEVRFPSIVIADAVAAEYARLEVPLTGDAKRSLFRINRDVRFSKDKSPYKTHSGIVWMRTGDTRDSAGISYLHIADEGCFVGTGFWQIDRPKLDAIREAIRVDPDAFKTILTDSEAAGMRLAEGDPMVRAPRGFEDITDPVTLPVIKSRNILLTCPLLKRDVGNAALVQQVVKLTTAGLPLLRFGWDAIAEAGLAPEWSRLNGG